MFDYKTSKLNIQPSSKMISIILTAVYVASIIPMLIIGFYNWPSADDFSMAFEVHEYYASTGNILGVIGASFDKTVNLYNTWIGYFFSSFMTGLSPSVFSEKAYFLVPFIIIGMITLGVCFFFKALFVYLMGLDKHLSNSVAMLTLIIMINSLEQEGARAEAFYWYSGAINYSFMFGLSLLWIGILIKTVSDSSFVKRKHISRIVIASILGFMLGGANYMTALGMGICSFLIVFILLMIKLGKFTLWDNIEKRNLSFMYIPAICNILGLVVSAIAPGNSVRSASSQGFGAVKSVLVSVFYVFDMCISDMTRWEVILGLFIVAIISFKMADKMKHKLRHPFMFVLFAFLFTASTMTPPLYATGNISAGRLHSLVWMNYVVMMVLAVFYISIWIRQQISSATHVGTSFSEGLNTLLVITVVFLIFGSLLCVKEDAYYYSSTSAICDILNSNAKMYNEQCKERLALLTDSSVNEVELKELQVRPELLFYQDITADSDEWVNTVVARYYHKEKVRIK